MRDATDTFKSLAKRVVEAKGSDEALDIDIGMALGLVKTRPTVGMAGNVFELVYYEGLAGGCPHWTGSVDAALDLVEKVLPGYRVENLCQWEHELLRQRGPWTCDLARDGSTFLDRHARAKCSHAPTPALALVSAMLTAILRAGDDAVSEAQRAAAAQSSRTSTHG